MMGRNAIFMGMLTVLMSFSFTLQAATADEELWSGLKQTYFGDREIHENADDVLVLEAPTRAEDAAIVPIRVKSVQPQTADRYIKNLHIIIDKNPMPYSANFHLSPSLGEVDIATRVRIDQYTDMRAIAEMNDGSLYMVSRFVKASGGCSAPAGKDMEAAMARLGKMQIRMRDADIGEMTQAQVVVSHPNNSGLQFDQQTRGYIPPHYVKEIVIDFADENLITLEAGISISEDPSIRFNFTPKKHGILKAMVSDSKEMTYSMDKQI
ncbi:quinoprotein dehydrogenase-associated SoxYZ-like carrier [Methylophaga pinxianii]|uniref:quinoprotein dehydrogenase-associated SoxYZ-like carrier n=1 Tax=Methylophaga pinxianii TaxID=2881052 RepID=UPI001CF187C9|nr:quinoprotein dehydrogenase-associated SoxYZ-like carrier [Methylophaga pinxianii]MCB2425927.1 quinoprotein dehydrogenase-associated SoxYZ-like carrier [Methylophaga pinxianii]UPH45701.1 quinoprotein dehydrogenase-associated SoxYZ-like carrier [Methylophaga pinxianii]